MAVAQANRDERMPKGKIKFRLKNRLDDLGKLKTKIDQLDSGICMTKQCKCETNLVLEELFTNIISYGFRDKGDHAIDVTIWCRPQELTIRIEDDGVPFNPAEAEQPDLNCSLEERELGGLGVYFAKRFTDHLHYERKGKKNILTLKKILTAGKAKP